MTIGALKEELMQRLTAMDPKALSLIRYLERRGHQTGDMKLLGYVYYRYAYYYYFTAFDHRLFRKYLQTAIRFLLRNEDPEYLASTYNLVAYDAQDHGCYDLAYAYFRMAVSVSEPLTGISIPGLVEASAGRLMMELGRAGQGRDQIRRAIKKLHSITSMHVYHYNMIINYADEALSSFLLHDTKGVARTLTKIDAHFNAADHDEKLLSMSYVLLPAIYHAVLSDDKKAMQRGLKKLYAFWKSLPEDSSGGLIFEVESVFRELIKRGYVREAGKLLQETADMGHDENPTIAMRYLVMQHTYFVRTRNVRMQRENLLVQHRIMKERDADQARVHRYAMDFLDMTTEIAREHASAIREQEVLKEQAVLDALTGLPNRGAMNRALVNMFEQAKHRGRFFAVGIMDVDRFKQFNDTYGHQTGDLCLKGIGEVLKPLMEEKGVYCARYGGDEFVICISGRAKNEVRKTAEEIARSIREILLESDLRQVREEVSASHGICAGIPAAGEKLWDYLSAADRALYALKKSRPGHFRIVDASKRK